MIYCCVVGFFMLLFYIQVGSSYSGGTNNKRTVTHMEQFVEQIERKRRNTKDILIKTATVSAVIILTLICFMLSAVINFYMAVVAMFILMGGIYVIWYVFSNLKIEYEYSIISGSITLAKIMAKRKRKRIVEFEASAIEDMVEYGNSDFDTRLYNHVYDVRGCSGENKTYAATITSPKHGRSVVLFNPNEKFLEAMKPYLSRQLVVNLFYKR